VLILDRVACDLCRALVGQLFNMPAVAPGLLDDQGAAPHFCVCPDCLESSAPADSEAA